MTQTQRALLLRRVVAAASWRLGRSARFGGFADALGGDRGRARGRRCSIPDELEGELAELYRAYRDELDRLGLWDRELERASRRRAGRRRPRAPGPATGLRVRLRGPDRRRVGAARGAGRPRRRDRLAPVRARSRRVRVALSHLRRPDTSSRRRDEELPPHAGARTAPLAHLERTLFGEERPRRRPLDGSIRFLEGAGLRGTLELVGRRGARAAALGHGAPDEIAVVCPSLDRWRAPLDTAFTTLGSPYALEGRLRLGQTPFGQALARAAALRLARTASGATSSRSSGLRSRGSARAHVDFLEGRLRGRGVNVADRVEEEIGKLRGQPLPHLEAVRTATDPLDAVAELARAMTPRGSRARVTAHGRGRAARPACPRGRCASSLAELEGWRDLGGELTREEAVSRSSDSPVRLAARPARQAAWPCSTSCARARAASKWSSCSGWRKGASRARAPGSPFLDDDQRPSSSVRRARRGCSRTDPVARDRYLFYTACTRPTRRLYLVREAATDEGSPREASPFWDEARGALRARGGRALDAAAAARGADLAARERAERARAAAGPRGARVGATAARLTLSRARTAGSGGSSGRSAPSTGRPG